MQQFFMTKALLSTHVLLMERLRFMVLITKNYRYNMFVCNGILFNHESPRRGETL
jgi:hypothetical protein